MVTVENRSQDNGLLSTRLNCQRALKIILQQEQWTQKQFSQETGIDRSIVSKIYTGKRNIPKEQRTALRKRFPYVDYHGELENPQWINEITELLVQNASRLTSSQIKTIEQSVLYNINVSQHVKPRVDDSFNIYRDWGFFASDMLNTLETLLTGLLIYDHIYCERIEDPFDENSRYNSGLVGRKPFGRRTIKALRDATDDFMKEPLIWNRGHEVEWYSNNEDYLPWKDSVMAIPIVTREGRGIIVSIHRLDGGFTGDDLELVQSYIHSYFRKRQVPILIGDELMEFRKNGR